MLIEEGARSAPILGGGLALTEAVTGKDYFNGRQLNAEERIGGLVPYAAFGGAKLISKALRGEARVAGVVAREASAVKSGGKVADDISREAGAVRGTGNAFEENLASCVGQNSFSPETLVATDTGEKPIGEVKVGEQVLAYGEASGTNGNYPIQAVLINDDPAEVFLSINGETVETTPEHPWYTEDKGWVNAGELRLGEHIRKANISYDLVARLVEIFLHLVEGFAGQ